MIHNSLTSVPVSGFDSVISDTKNQGLCVINCEDGLLSWLALSGFQRSSGISYGQVQGPEGVRVAQESFLV